MSAARLRALHVPGEPVLLPNAWDAASARAVVSAGFPVVATASAAVAAALGYPDGQGTPPAEMFAAVRRIAAAVDVPVTADVEAGYDLPPAELAERLAEAGAVGCNLEDTRHPGGGLVDAGWQAERIAALCAAGDLVVNARVDVAVSGPEDTAALAETVDRARRYLAAGAHCVYPIKLRDAAVLGAFVEAVRPAPVNALYLPGSSTLVALAELGVARISFGPGLFRSAMSHVDGLLRGLAEGVAPY
ncbi:isocitrate lyase/PEP mutase family protein [Actinophytocola xanthii]|uniref:Carboxyvinyl-carboxyphosphonate phosphorylmutase n=1 Tax=Actinophytocola xanthii TaxID=1912961 RepID=A0A1Q8CGD7_9PSEU|nr:isocitrate lyase/phosphoenolpyruvate mutase family protein [Actinophytocola xanthii]OLF13380.1 carboxyvinyl-carboxyphosphonate phosphorylmutase [Actinophytocola xanthii]